MPWSVWRAAHPDTLVLEKPEDERERTESHYADYFADPEALFMDELGDGLAALAPKDVVYGVSNARGALAVTEKALVERGAINAIAGAVPVAFLRAGDTGMVIAVDRRLEGRVVVVEPLPGEDPSVLFRDALSGETRGVEELEGLRVDKAFWYAWSRSHPGTSVLVQ